MQTLHLHISMAIQLPFVVAENKKDRIKKKKIKKKKDRIVFLKLMYLFSPLFLGDEGGKVPRTLSKLLTVGTNSSSSFI